MNDADLIPGLLPAARYGVRHTVKGRWVFDRSDNKPLVVKVERAFRAQGGEAPEVCELN